MKKVLLVFVTFVAMCFMSCSKTNQVVDNNSIDSVDTVITVDTASMDSVID